MVQNIMQKILYQRKAKFYIL